MEAKQLNLFEVDRPNDELAYKDEVAIRVISAAEEFLTFGTKHQLLDLLRANFGFDGFNVS